MATVKIACRLPHGVMLDDPRDEHNAKKRVQIKGLVHSQTRIHIPEHLRMKTSPFDFEPAVVTEVDENFWNAWYQVHGTTFAPFVNGVMYVVKSESDAIKVAENSEPTGFEPLDATKEFDVAGAIVTVDDQRG